MIYIIIPVYNRQAFTLACLKYLSQQTVTEQQVIVVDDGSTDGTGEQIRQRFPKVTVLTGTGSLWWAGATNLGISYVLNTFAPSADDFILTLNDDIEIGATYLSSLLAAYGANKPCIVGSVSVDVKPPHTLIYAGNRLNLIVPKIENWADTRYKNNYELLTKTGSYFQSDSLPGRGMLVPVSVFNAIGLLDEKRFRHHMADLDFSVSARKAGFPLVISTASVVREYTDATAMNVKMPMSIRQFREALFSVKSPIKSSVRLHFALKHSPLTYLYFGLDMLQILGGYAVRRLKAFLPLIR